MESKEKKFYITTTLPYVNSDPHVGFAMEIIRADVIARYKRLMGHDVFFNTGTDEHGAKIYENAVKEGVDVQVYVDRYAEKFKELAQTLNIEDVHFIRTTDEKHVFAAKEMWKRCYDNGYIYKKAYQTKYCVGCELSKTDSELVDGKCPLHLRYEIELIDEENYFFKFSEFQKPLLQFYESTPDFVVPDFRYNEIKSFVERGLEDFSISRLKSKMPWGVAVPTGCCDKGDEETHVMYVWFDALTSYISTLGWPVTKDFEIFWVQDGSEKRNVIQYCGKDNLRQQSAMWQAMLMASGLPNSTQIVIDGFITSGGQKMSKSVGNVISPFDVLERFKSLTDYPEDVLRFVLLHDIPSFEDGDVTMQSIEESYQAHLANGIGNLTNRIMKLVEMYLIGQTLEEGVITQESVQEAPKYVKSIEEYDLKKAIQIITSLIGALDQTIQKKETFKLVKTNPVEGKILIYQHMYELKHIAEFLTPFLPKTSAKILECIRENKMPEKPLFNRLA